MAGKKRFNHSGRRSTTRIASAQGFYTPFEGLDQHLPRTSHSEKVVAPSNDAPRGAPDRSGDGECLFFEAMRDVVPLNRSKAERVPPSSPAKTFPRFCAQEEMEVCAYLVDLVAGDAPFELSFSDEYVDGAVVGLSPQILKKLRNGDFSYQDYLDLHGYNREEGRLKVIEFVQRSFARKSRCILIVPGRGLNSKDGQPVLKRGLVAWLTRAPLKRIVLAFASARSYDGGAGAFYVLLRRNESRARFTTPAF